ncbi:hypothetical protein N7466_010469 [Penicillium verhagenii]|uniref:uncharacterized protein n=1 Tax=Penicillium verhagenii TaxID=1562060 RepID=UPI002545A191|nr:uncharacterized protein N7466_010469 [Penicillium verhagenii]KAJ5918477.1 hypothetical protein N7466_010469 [Penicillium verhagenii]
MIVKYAKFINMARESKWRSTKASLNYIETGTWTRQEHNDFSHQSPSFIGPVLKLTRSAARVYLPPDANTFLSILHHCLESRNYINPMVGSKRPTCVVHPNSLSTEEFDHLFTANKCIHFNYHEHRHELQGLLFGRPRLGCVLIAAYMEEGSTTTPFDTMLVKRTSRYCVAQAADQGASKVNEKIQIRNYELQAELGHDIVGSRKFIIEKHEDPEGSYDLQRFTQTDDVGSGNSTD